MKAQYNTKCAACGKNHIKVGDEITKYGEGWCASDCINSKFDTIKLKQRVEYDMLIDHNFHYGLSDVPKSTKVISTRQEFYKKALDLGLCDEVEYKELIESLPK